MDIKIVGISTKNPGTRMSQQKMMQLISRKRHLSAKEEKLYKIFLSDKSINTRYFAISKRDEFFVKDQDKLIERFQKEAAILSAHSLEKCLAQSAVKKDDIDYLAIATCTGYLCPGLTSYVVENSGLRKDITALDIVGMGCGGALPALRSGYDFLKSNKDSYAAIICTEVCSSVVSWGSDVELVLSNSIFGDGSAACILTNKKGAAGLQIIDFKSMILPHHRDMLRFRTENSRLRNVIKISVPKIAGELIKDIIDELFAENRITQDDIKFWAIHPGGRKVLDRIHTAVGLKDSDLVYSRNVLKNYGNMSSPSVLYVLKDILWQRHLKRGDKIVAASFGAGFSGYAALLTYE